LAHRRDHQSGAGVGLMMALPVVSVTAAVITGIDQAWSGSGYYLFSFGHLLILSGS
jgi:hypothetical protein